MKYNAKGKNKKIKNKAKKSFFGRFIFQTITCRNKQRKKLEIPIIIIDLNMNFKK